MVILRGGRPGGEQVGDRIKAQRCDASGDLTIVVDQLSRVHRASFEILADIGEEEVEHRTSAP